MPSDAQRIDAFDKLHVALHPLLADRMTNGEIERLCHVLCFDASPAQVREALSLLQRHRAQLQGLLEQIEENESRTV